LATAEKGITKDLPPPLGFLENKNYLFKKRREIDQILIPEIHIKTTPIFIVVPSIFLTDI